MPYKGITVILSKSFFLRAIHAPRITKADMASPHDFRTHSVYVPGISPISVSFRRMVSPHKI